MTAPPPETPGWSPDGGSLPYEAAVERLRSLPADLPEAPRALIPYRTDGGDLPARPPYDPTRSRPAAVLVLVIPGPDGEARIVLTERVERGGHHSGEVSFPGGSVESGDVDLVATALREAREEIGLDAVAAEVTVLGRLHDFWIPVSEYLVTPIVAAAARRPLYVAQPTEVARILEPPLTTFLPGARIVEVERDVRGWRLRYGAYPVDGLLVWGATARVLGQLGALLAS